VGHLIRTWVDAQGGAERRAIILDIEKMIGDIKMVYRTSGTERR
jgi:hypothetical protein